MNEVCSTAKSEMKTHLEKEFKGRGLLSIQELSGFTGDSTATLIRKINLGLLKARKPGGFRNSKWRVKLDDAADYICCQTR